jgi:hypothetical protein
MAFVVGAIAGGGGVREGSSYAQSSTRGGGYLTGRPSRVSRHEERMAASMIPPNSMRFSLRITDALWH